MENYTCIIPFYNETQQLLSIVESVLKVASINQVILVDDGSTNDISEEVIKRYKDVKLIKLPKNLGKSKAVKAGLEKATNNHVLMLDADYKNVESKELETIIGQYTTSGVDMLLLKVMGGNNWLDRTLRKETLFTGFRILKRSDLENVFKLNPKGYQLEVAINEYMINNDKRVAWLPTKVLNVHKSQKWGFLNGIIKSMAMEISILNYLGARRFFKQVTSFATNKL